MHHTPCSVCHRPGRQVDFEANDQVDMAFFIVQISELLGSMLDFYRDIE